MNWLWSLPFFEVRFLGIQAKKIVEYGLIAYLSFGGDGSGGRPDLAHTPPSQGLVAEQAPLAARPVRAG